MHNSLAIFKKRYNILKSLHCLYDGKYMMNISPNVSLVNYQNFFKTLLWLEELQHELDVQFYKKVGITLNFPERDRVTGLLLVEFYDPGLAENRPCLMRNDRVFVCLTEEAKNKKKPQWYEGVVHYVKNQSVALGFDQERFALKFDNKTKFNLDFTINRFNFRVCHRAVDLCMTNESFRRLLFPPRRKQRRTQNFINDMYYLPDIILYDTKILNNYEQIQSIQHILSRQPYNYPYIIFGPPGTGKTVTIVETIKQILFRVEKSHVLACAPSNSAADIITEKLLEHFTNEHVFRMYSESRLKIAAACFPDRHFTHVILDEAGHAMECEALVGIGGVLSKDGQLILAGDPHQLGPMVRNLQAVAGGKVFPVTGLDTSLLERVMKCRFYSNQESGYDPKYVTKLVMNYRSHKDILHIPNKLFYNSELQACGADHIVNEFANWSHLPTRGFPIIVHSVDGEDRVEHHSPSYHNPQEVAEVISYLHKLLLETGPENIGIITPYRLQVEKLKSAIERFGKSVTKNLKIGSVEDFQGEEKKVIIISTVRASKRHLAKDELFKLGFLRNPKRFNVAVTRAQCLLILICCTDVLLLDSNWKALIDYARSKGGYVGKKYREPKESIDEIIAKMENLDIRPKVGDISLKQIVEVPSWKRRT
ncbi:putative helicase mov-10-B.1 [Armadillidium vulgare]|nr:putative helicase mov-10-B.1 [Armadillidium vulgare]